MKIKIINIKDISKYLAKFIIIFGVISILVNFFYNRKDVKSCFSFNSKKLLSMISQEIVLLNNNETINNYFVTQDYKTKTIDKEFELIKVVAAQNSHDFNLENNNENNGNTNLKEIENNVENVGGNEIQEAKTNVEVEVLPSNISNKYTHEIFGVQIKNESDYNLYNEITDLNVDYNKQDILIFHTHTCESYTPTEQFQYEASGTFRTTDLNYSVVRVGDELEKYLCNYGYSVVHDKSYHDYPAYTGSYDRSIITVKNLLSKYQNTDIVIDLHRDAIGDNTYAPKVKIGEEYCARLMLVIGTDGGGLTHDNWRENLKIAIKLQQKANELYPGLFKPIIVRNSRYNHQVSKGACIIEVGATGNTLEECLNSMKYLSKIYDEI